MRHLYLLLLLSAAAAAIPYDLYLFHKGLFEILKDRKIRYYDFSEEMEIEGLETLVALSAPKSEEEADNKSTFFSFKSVDTF